MRLSMRRIPWTYVIGGLALAALIMLTVRNWAQIQTKTLEAVELVRGANLAWLAVALLAIGAGFLCAGQIYGRVLATLGYKENPLWLSSAALVTILCSQALPVGTVASYAFLTTSLRRRKIPATSVAMIASLELLSWGGAMLLLFIYGIIYVLLTTSDRSIARASLTGFTMVAALIGGYLFVGSRPRDTLQDWAMRLKRVIDRVFGPIWHDSQVHRMVEEITHNRQLLMEQPVRLLLLVCLQLTIFALHSFALLSILHALGLAVAPLAVLAAYGLSLIVSTYTVLPAGGGTVEAALTLGLTVQGVPLGAALGATFLFRLFSFWLLLPLGTVCYRLLTKNGSPE